MLETLFGSAMVKAATVLAGLTLTTGGAAAAGVLPQVAQDKVASAMELVLPVDIPDSADAAKAKRAEGEKVAQEHKADEAEVQQDVAGEQDGAGQADDFGQSVAGDAKSGLPQQDGRAFGEKVSANAPKAPQATKARPAGTPTASDNPGASYRESAPTAESNPGTSYRESAPTTQPEETPTGDSNPGTSYRESAPTTQPEETPTGDSNPGTSRRP
ncbi:MAG: hypothetical protein M3P34_00600 [Actinomycetota bacterium]|nr:hypothetical protein [Actinomycetota bacterium]